MGVEFSWQSMWQPLAGGMLLGLSAALLLLMNGRIAGISGIVSGLLKPAKGEWQWRLLFVVGMLFSGAAMPLFDVTFPSSLPASSWSMVAFAGLLVGIGTKLGNGCTSGHGICGVGRLSKRSIVATCVFMAVAILTVFVRIHVL